MLFPIKFKNIFRTSYILQDLLNNNLKKRLYSLSLLRFENVFKTTNINRFPITQKYLFSINKKFNYIHDIGCSDGSSSFDLMQNLDFRKYECLDKYINVNLYSSKTGMFLYDNSNNLHIYENKFLFVYLDPLKKNNGLFERFFSFLFIRKYIQNLELQNLQLINPKIKLMHKNIIFKEFDIFKSKLDDKSDLIIIFNLLDKFLHKKKFINIFKIFIKDSLNDNGLLVIGENNKIEKSSIYIYKNSSLNLFHQVNNGSIFKF